MQSISGVQTIQISLQVVNMAIPGYVLPGQIIAPVMEKEDQLVREYEAGPGCANTVIDNVEAIVASIIGQVVIEEQEYDQMKERAKLRISVFGAKEPVALPDVDDIVLGRVVRINQKQVNVEILAVGDSEVNVDTGVDLHGIGQIFGSQSAGVVGNSSSNNASIGQGFGGIIRLQDIRAAERDKVRVEECFAPGDIVRAAVISLGDGSNYYLTTARNDLGVVLAKSPAGLLMEAVDWQTMRCPATGVEERRKCAKPY